MEEPTKIHFLSEIGIEVRKPQHYFPIFYSEPEYVSKRTWAEQKSIELRHKLKQRIANRNHAISFILQVLMVPVALGVAFVVGIAIARYVHPILAGILLAEIIIIILMSSFAFIESVINTDPNKVKLKR